jgi:hypothetical protein
MMTTGFMAVRNLFGTTSARAASRRFSSSIVSKWRCFLNRDQFVFDNFENVSIHHYLHRRVRSCTLKSDFQSRNIVKGE